MKAKYGEAFLMGVGFHYLASHSKGFFHALSKGVQADRKRRRIEFEQQIDPMGDPL